MSRFYRPNIKDFPDKTPVPPGRGFVYDLLPSSERFEALIYTLYKQKISNDEEWHLLYDDILLTNASGDGGADCILFKDKVPMGVIQCKKYSDNVDRTETAKEILKFLLYSMGDDSLMPGNTAFTYYFVVSKGFREPAVKLLDHFYEELKNEPALEKWVTDLKKKYVALRSISFENIKEELFAKIEAMTIKKLFPLDLDMELAKPYNIEIQPLFFEIRTVTENSLVERSTAKILEAINEIDERNQKIPYNEEEIIQKFDIASIQLKEWKADLSKIPDSHIARGETQKIINWIKNPLQVEKEPILMLSGNPGYGKSVILKDALLQLKEAGIPVIGIKADRYYSESLERFNEATNLVYPLEKQANQLLKTNDRIVILIDQIDSLSVTVTYKRIYLDVYRQLIDNILLLTKNKPAFIRDKVRLVVAIREFDLLYEYEFNFFKKFEKIEVELLEVRHLDDIFRKLNLRKESISEQLMDLLRIPAYLEIFCKIYSPFINLNRLNTAMNLMDELWAIHTGTGDEIITARFKTALYVLAEKMKELNQLSVDLGLLPAIDRKTFEELKNQGLILISGNQLQFFHQTFYDYVFARSFVESDRSLEEFITSENQSIYIRPSLKIMLAFYRQSNFALYMRLIRKILFSGKYRFHLQLLIVHDLGFLQQPTTEEIMLVADRLLKQKRYFLPFLESFTGNRWFQVIRQKKFLDRLVFSSHPEHSGISKLANLFLRRNKKNRSHAPDFYRNLWSSILRRALKDNSQQAIDYLYHLKRFKGDSQSVLWILLGLKKWDAPLSLKVVEKYAGDVERDWYTRLSIIDCAVDDNYEWSLQQLKTVLGQENQIKNNNGSDMYGHLVGNIFEKMSKADPVKFFTDGIAMMQATISEAMAKKEHYNEDAYFVRDGVYTSYDFIHDWEEDDDNKLISLVYKTGRDLARINSPAFQDFIGQYKDSNLVTFQVILTGGYMEQPDLYREHIFSLVKKVILKDPDNSVLKHHVRNFLESCFKDFNTGQKDELLDLILQMKTARRAYYMGEMNGKKAHYSYFGYLNFEYFSSVPREEIFSRPVVKRLFQEFERRYKPATNRAPNRTILQPVPPPLKTNAYIYLTFEDWVKTMYKFNRHYVSRRDDDYRGGLDLHAREFEKVMEGDPEKYFPLLERLINHESVEDEYIVAGLDALVKKEFDPERLVTLYKPALNKTVSEYGMMRMIWMAGYFRKHNLMDQDIFNFLCFQSLQGRDPENTKGFHSVRGAAVIEVIKCYNIGGFAAKIFDTVKSVTHDEQKSVRLSALNQLAFLMYLDKEKTLELFMAFTGEGADEEIYEFAMGPAQYLARYKFPALVPYFKKMIDMDIMLDNVAVNLAVAWLNGEEGSHELLQSAFRKSDKAKAKAIDVAIKNFINSSGEAKTKCSELFCMFLNHETKETVSEYNSSFLHDMNPADFEKYFSFIDAYHRSVAAKKDPHYYFDYLIRCSRQYPVQCLELVKRYDTYDRPDAFKGPHYEGSEPVKIVIGALNGLYEKEIKDISAIEKGMNLFDAMLQDTVCRGSAFEVLNKL